MSGPERVSVQELAAELRELDRRRKELMRSAGTVPTRPEEISSVMDRYDRLLLDAAVMLEVDIPAHARSTIDPRRLTHRGRIALEEAVGSAGLVFTATESEGDV